MGRWNQESGFTRISFPGIFTSAAPPVHEALQLLAEKGLVEILPGRGTRVTPIDLDELRQCYPLISHLHGYAVRLAFDRINSQVLERLHQLNQHLQECIASEDLLKTQEADRQFHQVFLDLADNRYLSAMITDLAIHINRTELQFLRSTNSRASRFRGISGLWRPCGRRIWKRRFRPPKTTGC